jgi:hypothetical protein
MKVILTIKVRLMVVMEYIFVIFWSLDDYKKFCDINLDL